MKKFASLMLALLTLAAFAPSLPAKAQEAIEVTAVKETTITDTEEKEVFSLTNNTAVSVNMTIVVYDQAAKADVQTVHLVLNPGDTVPVMAMCYKDLKEKGKINLYRYTLTGGNGYKNTLFYAQKHMGFDDCNRPVYSMIQNARYRNNTASTFGPHFRDVAPGSTKLWYMFTPLDLSRQGRQTYELVGSNMYVIGEVYVDVSGDTALITYHNYYDGKGGTTETKDEFLGLYNSYQDVVLPMDTPTKQYVNPPTRFRFGVPFSIQYDLGGDTNVLMLVRNVVDYWRFPRSYNAEFRRFWENSPENTALRNQMLLMMDPITPVYGK